MAHEIASTSSQGMQNTSSVGCTFDIHNPITRRIEKTNRQSHPSVHLSELPTSTVRSSPDLNDLPSEAEHIMAETLPISKAFEGGEGGVADRG